MSKELDDMINKAFADLRAADEPWGNQGNYNHLEMMRRLRKAAANTFQKLDILESRKRDRKAGKR